MARCGCQRQLLLSWAPNCWDSRQSRLTQPSRSDSESYHRTEVGKRSKTEHTAVTLSCSDGPTPFSPCPIRAGPLQRFSETIGVHLLGDYCDKSGYCSHTNLLYPYVLCIYSVSQTNKIARTDQLQRSSEGYKPISWHLFGGAKPPSSHPCSILKAVLLAQMEELGA